MKKFSILVFFATFVLFANFVYAAPINSRATQIDPQASWANVNRVDLGQFDSGIVELEVGQSMTVSGVASFSGDQAAIDQVQVSFENIDPALSIDYDGNLTINGNTGTFSFTVTLNSDENRPHTFKIDLMDSLIDDDNHLTSYSDTQTVIASTTSGTSSSESSSSESSSSESSSSESSSSESSSSESSSSESSSSESSSSESSSSESSSSESSSSESSSSEPSSSESSSSEPSSSESSSSEPSYAKANISEENYSKLPKTGEHNTVYWRIFGLLFLILGSSLIKKEYTQKK